jgi:hypothetical protein
MRRLPPSASLPHLHERRTALHSVPMIGEFYNTSRSGSGVSDQTRGKRTDFSHTFSGPS